MEWVCMLIGLFMGYFAGLMANTNANRDSMWESMMNRATREMAEGQTLCFHASVSKFRGDGDDDSGETEPEPDPVLQNWRNN